MPHSITCVMHWIFAYMRKHLSLKSLNGQSPLSMVTGDTVDTSIFFFPWFAPVWYYHPCVSFPVEKILPGYFLRIKDSIGDKFFFYILSTG